MKTNHRIIYWLGGGALVYLLFGFFSWRAVRNAIKDGKHWRVVTESEWKADQPKLGPEIDASAIRQIIERNSPLPMLRVSDMQQLPVLIHELSDYSVGSDQYKKRKENWRSEYVWEVRGAFLYYRSALLRESCPQNERDLYCDTLINLFRLRVAAGKEMASLESFLMDYLTMDWYGSCRLIAVPSDGLESTFMKLGWYQFLRTGKLPEGLTMKNIFDGTNLVGTYQKL